MKKLRSTVSILLAVLMLAALLCACGGGKTKDVPVADLAAAVTKALGKENMADPGANYVKGYMRRSPEEIGDYVIMKNVMGTSIDEIGIFKSGTMDAAAIKEMIDGYIKMLQDSWINYQPEEEPKLKGAETRTVGDYTMYVILSDADKETAFKAFESALK